MHLEPERTTVTCNDDTTTATMVFRSIYDEKWVEPVVFSSICAALEDKHPETFIFSKEICKYIRKPEAETASESKRAKISVE